MSEIKFKRDTSFRKQFFVPDSFAHPAKMDAQLLIWITETYTKVGETILDPMAGSGTTMLACGLGRNVVLVELEGKFCKMMRDNWEEVKMRPQLGYNMGDCQIIQGDSRNLDGLLVDKIVTSPPYAETGIGDWQTGRAEFQAWVINELATKGYVEWQGKRYTETEWRAMNHGRLDGRTTKGVHKHPTEGYGETGGQIGNLPYGDIDAIVTSPPYEEAMGKKHHSPKADKLAQEKSNPVTYTDRVDAIVTSPPYEHSLHETGSEEFKQEKAEYAEKHLGGASRTSLIMQHSGEQKSPNNIGNLKSQSYLEAMLLVYKNCFAVLKSGGLLILVTKNFIRQKQIIRLDTDTIKLCEQAGFKFLERHYRKLPSQSFWRVIYHQKHPEVEQINYEDVLVFVK